MSFQKAITEQAMKGINDSANDTLQEVFARRFSRRDMLRKAAAIAPTLVLSTQLLGTSEAAAEAQAPGKRPLGFQPISLSGEDAVLLPDGYGYQVLLKWGDSIFDGAPDMDLNAQDAVTQSLQFGYNCDFNGYFSLPY